MHTFCTYWISKGGNHRVCEKFSFWGSTRRQIRCAHAEQGGHDPQGSFLVHCKDLEDCKLN